MQTREPALPLRYQFRFECNLVAQDDESVIAELPACTRVQAIPVYTPVHNPNPANGSVGTLFADEKRRASTFFA